MGPLSQSGNFLCGNRAGVSLILGGRIPAAGRGASAQPLINQFMSIRQFMGVNKRWPVMRGRGGQPASQLASLTYDKKMQGKQGPRLLPFLFGFICDGCLPPATRC